MRSGEVKGVKRKEFALRNQLQQEERLPLTGFYMKWKQKATCG